LKKIPLIPKAIKTKRMKKYFLFIAIILALYSPLKLYAGFPVGKGRSVLCFAYNAYYSHRNFDDNGHLQDGKPGDYFISHYFSLYAAHGLTRRWDIFAAVPFVYEISKSDGVTNSRNGFADAMAGLEYTFVNKDFNKYTTLKGSIIWPLYDNGTNTLDIGYGVPGMDFTINYVYTPRSIRNKGYYMLEGSYRHYFADDGPDQFLFDAERSFTIKRFNFLNFGISGTYSSSTNKSSNPNPTLNKDFAYAEVKLTYGRRVWRNITLYLEGFYTPIGRNSGEGIGGVFLAVFKFP